MTGAAQGDPFAAALGAVVFDPHELERGALAAAMHAETGAQADATLDALTPENFSDPRHALAFEAMRALRARGALPTLKAVMAELERSDHADIFEGDYLALDVDALGVDPETGPAVAAMLARARPAAPVPRVAGESWPEPMPLGPPPLPEYPLRQLPAAMQYECADVAESLQAAPELAVAAALGALATVTQGKLLCGVRRMANATEGPWDWVEPLTVWEVAIAPPGEAKSPTFKAMLAPLHELEAERDADPEVREARKAVRTLRARIENTDRRIGRADAKDVAALVSEAEALREELRTLPGLALAAASPLLGGDCTSEALARALPLRNERASILEPEGSDVFRHMNGAYQDRINPSLWLKGHDGEWHEVTRSGLPEPIKLTAPLVTMAVAVQPAALADVLKSPLVDRGVLERCAFYLPDPLAGTRTYRSPHPRSERTAAEWRKCLCDLDALAPPNPRCRAPNRPPGHVVPLLPEAYEVMADYCERTEPTVGAGGAFEPLSGWMSKRQTFLTRRALLLHCALWFDNPEMLVRGVEANSMARACLLHEYHAAVALRVLAQGAAGPAPVRRLAARAVAWLQREQRASFKVAELRAQLHGKLITDAASCRPVLDVLEEHHYIRPAHGSEGASASQRAFEVNPRVLEGAPR